MIPPGVCLTKPATPSLPLPPKPAGQLTAVALPTLVAQSGLTLVKKSVKMNPHMAITDRLETIGGINIG